MASPSDQVSVLLEEFMSLSPGVRDEWLSRLRERDMALANEVASLSRYFDRDSFLDGPASPLRLELDNVPSSDLIGKHINGYDVVRQIGEGGHSVVFEGRNPQNGSDRVAIKVLRHNLLDTRAKQRFVQEFAALQRVKHEGIVSVRSAGVLDGGLPYLVIDLVQGLPLLDYCRSLNLSVKQRVELVVQVLRAVSYAHARGVLHRDIKPQNILVELVGTKPSARMIDFGVSKILDNNTAGPPFTTTTQQLGTRAYMSPEQVRIGVKATDQRSDIYAIGVVLYEVVTGRLPYFDADNEQELMRAITESLPQPMECEYDSVPQSLRWIAERALSKEPDRRFRSADDFAAELEAFLADRQVSSRQASRWYRTRHFYRRYRALVVGSSIAAVALAAGATASIRWALRAEARRRETEAQNYILKLREATSGLEKRDFASARQALDEVPVASRQLEWGWMRQLASSVEELWIADDAIRSLATTSDGSLLVGLTDGQLARFDPTGKLMWKKHCQSDQIRTIEVIREFAGRSDSWAITGTADGDVFATNVVDPQRSVEIAFVGQPVAGTAFIDSLRSVVVAAGNRIGSYSIERPYSACPDHELRLSCDAVCIQRVDECEVICGLSDGTLLMLRATERGLEPRWISQPAPLRFNDFQALQISSLNSNEVSRRQIVVAFTNGTVSAVSAHDGTVLGLMELGGGGATSLSDTPLADTVACYGRDGTVSLLSLADASGRATIVRTTHWRDHNKMSWGCGWQGALVTGGWDQRLLLTRTQSQTHIADASTARKSAFSFAEPDVLLMRTPGRSTLISLDTDNQRQERPIATAPIQRVAAAGKDVWIALPNELQLHRDLAPTLDVSLPAGFSTAALYPFTSGKCLLIGVTGSAIVVDASTGRYTDLGVSIAQPVGCDYDIAKDRWNILQSSGELIEMSGRDPSARRTTVLTSAGIVTAIRSLRRWVLLTSKQDRLLIVSDKSSTGAPIEIQFGSMVSSNLCASRGGDRVLAGTADGNVKVVDVETAQIIATIPIDLGVTVVAVWEFDNGDLVVILESGRVVHVPRYSTSAMQQH